MRKSIAGLFAGTLLISTAAVAKLPPLTPEQAAAAAAQKAQQQKQQEIQEAKLTRVQDRLAARYGSRGQKHGEQTDGDKMPKATSAVPGGVGPTPARPHSGESHSAPAK